MTTAESIASDPVAPTILVTLGTDHHRFERLMDWVERWLRDNPGRVRMIVQHGFSRLPEGAEGFQLCPRDELLELTASSDIVLTQGGPGGIMDSRDCGILPIVVPRVASLNEAVDDHQVSFVRHMADAGLVVAATTEQAMRDRLEDALADPSRMRIGVESAKVDATIARVGELITDLVERRPARYRRRHPDS